MFYDQTNTGIARCNIRGNKVWKGASSTVAIMTVVGQKAYVGASTGQCMFNLYKDVVFDGCGTEIPLYKLVGNRLYEGASTAKIVMNWTGEPLKPIALFAAINLLRTTYRR